MYLLTKNTKPETLVAIGSATKPLGSLGQEELKILAENGSGMAELVPAEKAKKND